MKLTTSNTFDVSQIANTQSYQELQTFFDYINVFSSDMVQAFNKQISLTENLKFTSLSLNLQHGVPVNIGQYTPISVLISSNNPYIGYNLSTNPDSTRNFTIYFKSTQKIQAKSAVWQAGTIVRYLVRDTSAYSPGDVLNFSSFGNANNNGNFPIVEIDATNKYIYVNNRKRTSATGDELKTSYVGLIPDIFPVTIGLLNA